jgi:hypothetical protein
MATRIRKANPVYATASAVMSSNGEYGHINIHVYEMFGRGATLKISCQSGGVEPRETYAWKHGLSNDYSVMGVETLKKGYWLMRSIERKMEKKRDEEGPVRSFADYALRVLQAAGVRKVHLLPGVNPGHVDLQTLPFQDPLKQSDLLHDNLRAMEQKIISMSSYRDAA